MIDFIVKMNKESYNQVEKLSTTHQLCLNEQQIVY